MGQVNNRFGNTLLTSGFFPPARAATTGASITLAGLQVIDGVQLLDGDRVLVKDQTQPHLNGIYAASSGPWSRTTDAAGNGRFLAGMCIVVARGDVNSSTIWECTATDDPVVVGSSDIPFVSISAIVLAEANEVLAEVLAAVSALGNQVYQYDTRTLAVAANVPPGVNLLRTFGYIAAGDGGGALYKKVVSQPSHAGKLQTADGAWWAITSDGGRLYPEMFSSTADTSAIQTAVDVANAIGAGVVQLAVRNYRAVKQGSNSYCLKLYGPVALQGGTATRDGVLAGTGSIISWGSSINTATDIVLWESTSWIQGGKISGIQFMPDGFNANVADITLLTKYGRNGLVIDGTGLFLNCSVIDCTFGPMNSGRSISIPSVGLWIDGRIVNNYIWGGVYAPTCGDNCSFTDNACNGLKVAFELGNQPGAGTMLVQHNHGIAAGGALLLRSGFKARVAHNFFELTQAHTGTGYLYDFSGDDGTLQSIEFEDCIVGCTGIFGLTGMVRFSNSIKSKIDNITLINSDPSVTYPIRITATNVNPYCGLVSGGGGFITESIYDPGFQVDSAATVGPIGYDVPLALSNGWVVFGGGYEVPRVRRNLDGTCHISGTVSSGTTTTGTLVATIPHASYLPKHVVIRSGPNSTTGVVNFGINNGSGQLSWRGTGDAAATGISCTYQGVGLA
ncbi:hypothetical protein ACVWXN_003456 [Bradyrhizobium sp. i1.4.4]